MKFEYNEISNLPKLSWLSIMDKNSSIVKVLHGEMVECRSDGFVAGIWNGAFTTMDFHKSQAFQGTGVCLNLQRGGGNFCYS